MISRLIKSINEKNAPIVVGLDPTLKLIPEHILNEGYKRYGENLEGLSEAVWEFNKAIIDDIYDLVPAVKPQIAMYEQFGIPGLAVFKRTVDYCREKGLIVIGDIKRGDIGSTSESYAIGHIGSVTINGKTFHPFDEDMVTVNPYLGSDGVKPFVDVCDKEDRGIFVLVKTSNKSSGEFQDRLIADDNDRPLYEIVGEMVNEWGKDSMDGEYSNVGAVVGATYPEVGKRLRALMPKAYILVPGYGAQGGKAEDLKVFFNEGITGAIINSSRGIIAAYKSDKYSDYSPVDFSKASRAAVLDMKEDILKHLT